MIYKTEICLDMSKSVNRLRLEYLKVFNINSNYSLIVNLKYTDYKNLIVFTFKIRDSKSLKIIASEEFDFNSNGLIIKNVLFKTCKTYNIQSTINNDIFLIKVTSLDVINEVKKNHYKDSEIKNSILFADFKNELQFIDSCIYVFDSDLNKETEQFFIDKALYFGYPDINTVFNVIDVDKNIDDILNFKAISLDDIVIKFYKICIFKIFSKRNVKLFNTIEDEYTKIIKLKTKLKNVL